MATRSSNGKRVLLACLGLLVVAVVGGIVVPTLACEQPPQDLQDYGVLPTFALVDDGNQPFTDATLRGHPTIFDFVFTRCDSICPVTSLRMERVQEQTFEKNQRIKLVSVSVDPEYDTPPRLAEYAQRYHAEPERWKFVTGSVSEVKKLVQGPFANSMAREGTSPAGMPEIAHNGHFVLVDGNLHIRGFYDSRDVSRLEQLMKDARFLARTQR